VPAVRLVELDRGRINCCIFVFEVVVFHQLGVYLMSSKISLYMDKRFFLIVLSRLQCKNLFADMVVEICILNMVYLLERHESRGQHEQK
jgi:hypothetical protein